MAFLRRAMIYIVAALALSSGAACEKMLTSSSLNTCQANSLFSASLFNFVYTPGNNSINADIQATSSIQGFVTMHVAVSAYGKELMTKVIDPCKMKGFEGLCPMVRGKISIRFSTTISAQATKDVPALAYLAPDLNATARVHMILTDTGKSIACVAADISNGKTVNLTGVKWATAIAAGLTLVASAVFRAVGHSNTAAHVEAFSLALVGYFQAQAMIGMTAIQIPPIIQAWTQNLQWSLGIVPIAFLQNALTWYQRATGGTPSTIFDSMKTVSVRVQKRSEPLDDSLNLYRRDLAILPAASTSSVAANHWKRANIVTDDGSYTVYGIQRVAFRSHIETTNLFMTGIVIFLFVVILALLGLLIFKGICELLRKSDKIKPGSRIDYLRLQWRAIMKSVVLRIVLIGYPSIVILCLWEFTQVDSPAIVVLAVVFLCGHTFALGRCMYGVIQTGWRSETVQNNRVFALFSSPQTLHRWGLFFVPFRTTRFYFMAPLLVYIFIKAVFIALAQKSRMAQAVGLVILEGVALIATSILRPWMDRSINVVNIIVCVMNFVNALSLLVFADAFGAPKLVGGAIGLLIFLLNAVFSTVLLLIGIISTTISFVRKNPDTRYRYMSDYRISPSKSMINLTATSELDELASTARSGPFEPDERQDLLSPPGPLHRPKHNYRSSSASSVMSQRRDGAIPPISPSLSLFPSDRLTPPPTRNGSPHRVNNS